MKWRWSDTQGDRASKSASLQMQRSMHGSGRKLRAVLRSARYSEVQYQNLEIIINKGLGKYDKSVTTAFEACYSRNLGTTIGAACFAVVALRPESLH